MRKCIFHIPNELVFIGKSGSQIRPLKMYNAFKNIGYEVDLISGDLKSRKNKIKEIKEKINNGTSYDFIYSESSTMPTLLTEKSHLPHIPLDFIFFKFCKSRGIPIGLFYRDMYWKYPEYKKSVSILKANIAILFYKYDLKKYEKLIDIVYLPTTTINDILKLKNVIIKPLPPALEYPVHTIKKSEFNKLRLFYVGGIGLHYDLTKLISAVSKCDFAILTICCRENEWKQWKNKYESLMCDNISIVHKINDELKTYYENVDIGMLFFDTSGYRKYAMPIKLFEYMQNHLPVISTTNSAAGDFIVKNEIGWSIKYDEVELIKLLKEIHKNKAIIQNFIETISKTIENNTWEIRATQVVEELTELRKER